MTSWKLTVLLLMVSGSLMFGAASCERQGEISKFELDQGNGSLPLEFQQFLELDGKVEPEKIVVKYDYRKGRDKTPTKFIELTGADRQKCLRMLKNTGLSEPQITEGGGTFRVTLIGANGDNEMGVPSNVSEWTRFADEMTRKAAD